MRMYEYLIITYFNIKFSHIIQIAEQFKMINICSLFYKQQSTISNNVLHYIKTNFEILILHYIFYFKIYYIMQNKKIE